MRFGLYAIYQGIEYKASFINSDLFILRSHNIDDLSKGLHCMMGKFISKRFTDVNWMKYTKLIPKPYIKGTRE